MIFSKNKRKQLKKAKQRLLRHFPSDSSYAESFRTLRTNLFFSVMEKDLKSVVITSSVEGEGKTTTASNLAYAIAQADRKVLLIDLDLRRRQLSRLFNLNREPGVTNLINDVLGIHLIKGNLDTYSVNDLIQLAKLQRMSCILDLDDQKSQVKITFERGRMTDIYWKNRPLSKKLANILINNKQLTEKEAFQALGHQKKSVQRLGTILYTMGLVSKQNISKALTVHTIEAIKTISSMETGRFIFSNSPSDNSKRSINHNIDFEILYDEFGIGSEQDSYFKNAIQSFLRPTDDPNLFVMPAGATPPNPAEMIGSERTKFVIDYMENIFDLIIIDAPPIVPATDALLAAPWTDGTIMVIKSGHADRKIIKEVLEQYKNAKQPIIGAVLNQISLKANGYYKYYNKYYSSDDDQ